MYYCDHSSVLVSYVVLSTTTTELLNAKLKSREKVEKYIAVITGDLIKHEEKWSKLLNNIG